MLLQFVHRPYKKKHNLSIIFSPQYTAFGIIVRFRCTVGIIFMGVLLSSGTIIGGIRGLILPKNVTKLH